MQKIARTADIPAEILQSAIIKNFRPEFKRSIIQNRAQDMDTILQTARATEIAQSVTGGDITINQVAKELKERQLNLENELKILCTKVDKLSVSQIEQTVSHKPVCRSPASITQNSSVEMEQYHQTSWREHGNNTQTADNQKYNNRQNDFNDNYWNNRRHRSHQQPRLTQSMYQSSTSPGNHYYNQFRQQQGHQQLKQGPQHSDRPTYFSNHHHYHSDYDRIENVHCIHNGLSTYEPVVNTNLHNQAIRTPTVVECQPQH